MPDKPGRDTIYTGRRPDVVDFAFDSQVAGVFNDMIRRSVPGYETLISLIGVAAETYARAGTRCYDLGCSLGAVSLVMDQRLGDRDCRIVAVDNAEPMVRRARENLARLASSRVIDLVCADVRDVRIVEASVVVLNYTLQFLPPEQRAGLIAGIAEGLVPGGVLILSEKIRFDDGELQEELTELHHAFKRANGYSDLEVSRKRTALENVLVPDSIEAHRRRLLDCGFRRADLWFQCMNFVSFLAVK